MEIGDIFTDDDGTKWEVIDIRIEEKETGGTVEQIRMKLLN